ncbi:JAB domain-containing protein [Fluviicola chungangensis]|uniref:DNA repair protein n=1 Tax=Fluviicola chungangensis TaxID=2597671 RepID=A0A556MGI6_9FLAO|nr:JAB domain-containing protein [Fluviicola chungangensis]TSJ38969.1 DNA repair protein [Fluviicola chungangensis]
MNVRLTKDQKIQIANSDDVFGIMQQILLRENRIGRIQEHFWIVGLDKAHKILFIELLALGNDNRVHIKAPQVFRMAIYKNAPKVILVHNHPSGVMKPGEDDLKTTDRLLKAGEIIEIDVIDHLIISEKTYFGFNQAGLIEELRNNGAYRIVERDRAELEKWRLDQEKEKGALEEKKTLAKKLLALNTMSAEEIRKLTGLGIREMNKILKELEK